MDKKRALFIINPTAGRTKTRVSASDIIGKMTDSNIEFSVHETKCRGDATNIVKEHSEGMDMVVCCGGDGTLNETINGVMDLPTRTTIGYVPMGSTNDLANTLNIPTNVDEATDLIKSGKKHSYDIGLFNNRYFCYIASFGAFTKASYSTNQKLKNRIGHLAYLLTGFTQWKDLRGITRHIKIEYDDGVIEDDFMFGGISNTTSVSGMFKFDPKEVKLNDGYFEVLLVKKINPLSAPVFLHKIIKQDYDGEHILFFRTRSIKLTSDKPMDWTLDGEYGGSHKTSMIHVLAKAIDIYSGDNDMFLPDAPAPAEDEEKEDD